jgi:hypothetical protein
VNARIIAYASMSIDVCERDRSRRKRTDLATLSTHGSRRRLPVVACRSAGSGSGDDLWERGSFGDVRHELVERYRGRWVAVSEIGDVVADADELGELLHACDGMGFGSDVALHRVPEADAPLVVGLG